MKRLIIYGLIISTRQDFPSTIWNNLPIGREIILTEKRKIKNRIDEILKWEFDNLSQAEFATMIGESRAHFNKICLGDVEPGVLKAIKIARALNKRVEDIWIY